MKTNRTEIARAGLLSSLAASLCCITPILAVISGASGIVSTFSWMEPLRPYLIGITITLIGYAWYNKLKPGKESQMNCVCQTEQKASFIQSNRSLSFITIFAVLMLAFPYYSSALYPISPKVALFQTTQNKVVQVKFDIKGMTCEACTHHINGRLSKVTGIVGFTTSFDKASSVVKFDKTKTDTSKILAAIKSTGYQVISHSVIKK